MIKILLNLSAFFFIFCSSCFSQMRLQFPKGSLEEALFEDAQDGRFNRLGLEQAVLIASGVTQADLLKYIQKIDSIQNHISLSWPMKRLSRLKRAQIILYFLHQTTFRFYNPVATEIQSVLDQGIYNCVSSTMLFNILCERFGVRTGGIEIPTHLYSVILDPDSPSGHVEVQTTVVQGFMIRNMSKDEFIFDPKIQTWHGKRQVNGVSLIAVIYYNRGIYWIREKNFEKALPYYQRAYALDPNFPTLTSLVAELYTGSGNQFFESENYSKASQIYEQGFLFLKSRHDVASLAALRKNLCASLINEANEMIKIKRWEKAQSLLKQALKLGPDQETIHHNQKVLFYACGQDFVTHKNLNGALHLYQDALKVFPEERGFRQNLAWTYAKIGENLLQSRNFKKAKIWFALAFEETGEPQFSRVCQSLEKV